MPPPACPAQLWPGCLPLALPPCVGPGQVTHRPRSPTGPSKTCLASLPRCGWLVSWPPVDPRALPCQAGTPPLSHTLAKLPSLALNLPPSCLHPPGSWATDGLLFSVHFADGGQGSLEPSALACRGAGWAWEGPNHTQTAQSRRAGLRHRSWHPWGLRLGLCTCLHASRRWGPRGQGVSMQPLPTSFRQNLGRGPSLCAPPAPARGPGAQLQGSMRQWPRSPYS